MKRGGKFLISTTMLAVAGCGGQQGKLEIRSTPTPLAQGERAVPYRIAEGRGQLARGNVALALEAFRLAQREDANSPDPLVGIAACYDQMGRFDLSRRSYEAALALAPSNVDILGAFAASLQLQGRTDEALGVRREIAIRSAAAAAVEQVVAAIPAPMRTSPEQDAAVPAVAVISVPAPAEPVNVAAVQEPELAPRTWAAAPVALNMSTSERLGVDLPAVQTAQVDFDIEDSAPQQPAVATSEPPPSVVQTAELGRSVTIKLPPARPVQQVPAPSAVRPASATMPPRPVPLAPALPVDEPPQAAALAPLRPFARPVAEPDVAQERGPRLERMSMGEIALITVPKPEWKSTVVAESDRATTVRFVPLREAYAVPTKVRLLNAARVNRLAARTRMWLAARGWQGLSIGNAQTTRTRSVILYPANQLALAQRLSRQFGFPIARRAAGSHTIVLLGTDAARHRALRPDRA